jgi:hypothetical protein
MNQYEVYLLYVSLKAHFLNPSYDYFKYAGKGKKVRATTESFRARPDQKFFEILANHKNPKGFILANMIVNKGVYIIDLLYSDQAETIYREWLRVKESLTYQFSSDLGKFSDRFNSSLICTSKSHPELMRMYMRGDIRIETVCIICDLTKCLVYWRKKLGGDPIFDDLDMLITKYSPFLEWDRLKIKKVMKDRLNLTK